MIFHGTRLNEPEHLRSLSHLDGNNLLLQSVPK